MTKPTEAPEWPNDPAALDWLTQENLARAVEECPGSALLGLALAERGAQIGVDMFAPITDKKYRTISDDKIGSELMRHLCSTIRNVHQHGDKFVVHDTSVFVQIIDRHGLLVGRVAALLEELLGLTVEHVEGARFRGVACLVGCRMVEMGWPPERWYCHMCARNHLCDAYQARTG